MLRSFEGEEEVLTNDISILFVQTDLVEHAVLIPFIVDHTEVLKNHFFPRDGIKDREVRIAPGWPSVIDQVETLLIEIVVTMVKHVICLLRLCLGANRIPLLRRKTMIVFHRRFPVILLRKPLLSKHFIRQHWGIHKAQFLRQAILPCIF